MFQEFVLFPIFPIFLPETSCCSVYLNCQEVFPHLFRYLWFVVIWFKNITQNSLWVVGVHMHVTSQYVFPSPMILKSAPGVLAGITVWWTLLILSEDSDIFYFSFMCCNVSSKWQLAKCASLFARKKKRCQILLMSLSKTVWILGLYSCKYYGIINLKIYIWIKHLVNE